MSNVFSPGWENRILPSESTDELCLVYWIHDDSCRRPQDDGYVGVTTKKRLHARMLEHRKSGKLSDDGKFTVLIEYNIESCYMFEAVLRPHPSMGWNICAGGVGGHKVGVPKSEETKKKIGYSNTGKVRKDLAERNRLNSRVCSCIKCRKESSAGYLYRDHRVCFGYTGPK